MRTAIIAVLLIGVGCTLHPNPCIMEPAHLAVVSESNLKFKVTPKFMKLINDSTAGVIANDAQLALYNIATGELVGQYEYDPKELYRECYSTLRNYFPNRVFSDIYAYELQDQSIGTVPFVEFLAFVESESGIYISAYFLIPEVLRDSVRRMRIMTYENFIIQLSNKLDFERIIYNATEDATLEKGFLVSKSELLCPNLLPLHEQSIPLYSSFSIQDSLVVYRASSELQFDSSLYRYLSTHSIYHPYFAIKNGNEIYMSDEKRIFNIKTNLEVTPSYFDTINKYSIRSFSYSQKGELTVYTEDKVRTNNQKQILSFNESGDLICEVRLDNFQNRTIGDCMDRRFVSLSLKGDEYIFTIYERP